MNAIAAIVHTNHQAGARFFGEMVYGVAKAAVAVSSPNSAIELATKKTDRLVAEIRRQVKLVEALHSTCEPLIHAIREDAKIDGIIDRNLDITSSLTDGRRSLSGELGRLRRARGQNVNISMPRHLRLKVLEAFDDLIVAVETQIQCLDTLCAAIRFHDEAKMSPQLKAARSLSEMAQASGLDAGQDADALFDFISASELFSSANLRNEKTGPR